MADQQAHIHGRVNRQHQVVQQAQADEDGGNDQRRRQDLADNTDAGRRHARKRIRDGNAQQQRDDGGDQADFQAGLEGAAKLGCRPQRVRLGREGQRFTTGKTGQHDDGERPQQEQKHQPQDGARKQAFFHTELRLEEIRLRPAFTSRVMQTRMTAITFAAPKSLSTLTFWYSSVSSISTLVPPRRAGVT